MAKRKKPERRVYETEPKKSRTREDDIVALAKERFKQGETAETKQRQREQEALRFYAGEQWLETIRKSREGQDPQDGDPATPPRPCLTVNKVREPVRQVVNAEREQDMGAELVPADDFGSLGVEGQAENEIKLREGLLRRIQRESDAEDARIWAAERAAIAGKGYWGVMTRYVHGKTFDQECYVRRIYNQFAVTIDPMHEQPDGSDAEWAIERTFVSWSEYQATYPTLADGRDNPKLSYTDAEWQALGDEDPSWFQTDGETRTCVVADYYFIERTTRTLLLLGTGESVWLEDAPEGVTIVDRRKVMDQSVKCVKFDGQHILEETDWPSPYIPFVKVIGEEMHPYDTDRRLQGMVEPAIDSNRGFNYMISAMVERTGLAPLPPWMMAAGQDEGFENEYKLSATRVIPVLHYNQKDLDGNPAPAPTRTDTNSNLQPISIALQVFGEAIRDTTGVPLSMNGNVDPNLRSAKAIKQMLDQGSQGTSNYQDNLRRSIAYETKILNSLLPTIYGRPGRMARIINGQGEPETILLHTPHILHGPKKTPIHTLKHPETGQITRVEATSPGAQVYTFTKDAAFNVAIKVTKAYNTRREQEASQLGDLIAADPQQMAVVGDLYFKYQDGPGHEQLSERYKAMLAPPVQALLAGQGPVDPKVAQAQAQAQQANQEIQKLQQIIQAKEIESKRDLQKAQMDNDTKIKVAFIQASAQLAAVDAKVDAENARTFVESEEKGIAKALDFHMQRVTAAADKFHEAKLQQTKQDHDAQVLAIEHAHEHAMADKNAQIASDQAAQQAATKQATPTENQ